MTTFEIEDKITGEVFTVDAANAADAMEKAKRVKHDMGPVKAFGIGVGQGASGNLVDEGADYLKSGVDVITGERAAFDEALEANRANSKEMMDVAYEDHPYASYGGEFLGALGLSRALPGYGQMTKGGSMIERGIGAGWNTGTLGAISGFGGGDDPISRAGGSALGGAFGLFAGPIGQAGGEMIGRGIGGVVSPFMKMFSRKGAGEQAGNEVVKSIARNRQNPVGTSRVPGRLTDEEFQEGLDLGYDLRNIDRAGRPGADLADAVATRSPDARARMQSDLQLRNSGMADRYRQWFYQHVPDGGSEAARDAMVKEAQKATRPLYTKAYLDKGGAAIEIPGALTSPTLTSAMQKASARAADDVAFKRGVVQMRGGIAKNKKTGKWEFTETPNLVYWDRVKRVLDGQIGAAKAKNNREEVGHLTNIKSQLVEFLDDAVPSYKDARLASGRYLGKESAGELAEDMFGKKAYDYNAVKKVWDKWTPAEQEQAKLAWIDQLAIRSDDVSKGNDISIRLFRTPKEERLGKLILGDEMFNKLDLINRIETTMRLPFNVVGQGSQTAPRQSYLKQISPLGMGGIAGGGIGYQYYGGEGAIVPGMAVGAMAGGALRSSSRATSALMREFREGLYERLDGEIADRLFSGDLSVLPDVAEHIARDESKLKWINRVLHPLRIEGALAASDAGNEAGK